MKPVQPVDRAGPVPALEGRLAPVGERIAALWARAGALPDAARVREGLRWMVAAHRDQRDRPDESPYLEHTTAVVETVLEWCPNALGDVWITASLHDAVEDQAAQLAAWGPGAGSDRERALAALDAAFGGAVAAWVGLLSNPDWPDHLPAAERNRRYLHHVRTAVEAEPWVAAVKLADFSTNALRLHEVPEPRRGRLAAKYGPVAHLFVHHLKGAAASHPLYPHRDVLIKRLDAAFP